MKKTFLFLMASMLSISLIASDSVLNTDRLARFSIAELMEMQKKKYFEINDLQKKIEGFQDLLKKGFNPVAELPPNISTNISNKIKLFENKKDELTTERADLIRYIQKREDAENKIFKQRIIIVCSTVCGIIGVSGAFLAYKKLRNK